MFEFVADTNLKLSKAIASVSDLKFGEIRSLLDKKDIKVNGKRINKDMCLTVGDTVTVYALNASLKTKASAFAMCSIVFEDDNVLLVNKQKGVNSDTLFEALSKEREELYYIHRLDLNTDGIIIFAKNKSAEEELLFGFKERTFLKYYKALVYGIPKEKTAVLSDYLIKNPASSTVAVTKKAGKGSKIVTGYKVLKSGRETSLLEVELFTGKTHQIRAHLAFYGHFIVGDGKYGVNEINKRLGVKKQQLTSYKLKLVFTPSSPLYYLNGKVFEIYSDIKVI